VKYNKNPRNCCTLVSWHDIDTVLKELHDLQSEIVAIGQAGLMAFVHYREKSPEREIKSPVVSQATLELIYEKYPRKLGKKAGMATLAREIKSFEDAQKILRAVERFRDMVKDRELKYIPYFSTFINKYIDDFLGDEPMTKDRYDFLNG
jgi:hypothetical protein